ncbi:hypothetical protein BASA81_000486 [Batrachochytrium salamandrivorans]|nr:hypothetical protein BASA81_000486 [Batrachochytrium salamandrivorans]
MSLKDTSGCILKLNVSNPNQGVLSGRAFPKQGVQVRLVFKRPHPKADVLVTNGKLTWMIKAACVVCGEAEEGQKRLEIMEQIYDLIQREEFSLAKQVFASMHRLLL